MAIFKEIAKADGSGIVEYHRIQNGMIVNMDYNKIANKPTINGVELIGDLKSEDLKIEGGSSSGLEIYDLGPVGMMDLGYQPMYGAHAIKIVGSYVPTNLNLLYEKFDNGEPLPKIICGFRCDEYFLSGEEIWTEEDVWYGNVELKPIEYSVQMTGADVKGFEAQVRKLMPGIGFVKHILQFWNMGNDWAIFANFMLENPTPETSELQMVALYGIEYVEGE